MLAKGLLLGAFLTGIFLAATAHAAPLIENEREGGQIRTVDRAGKTSTVMRSFGDAVFVPMGTDAIDTLVSAGAGARGRNWAQGSSGARDCQHCRLSNGFPPRRFGEDFGRSPLHRVAL